jgi:DNA replicative helicase MCM subunit Mcm2 (Cdc46/Mcm family)
MQPYSAAELREFVAFARARIQPSFTPAAEVRLIESYKELRRNARNENVSSNYHL